MSEPMTYLREEIAAMFGLSLEELDASSAGDFIALARSLQAEDEAAFAAGVKAWATEREKSL